MLTGSETKIWIQPQHTVKKCIVKAQTALTTAKIQYGEKRFSIWRMEILPDYFL